MLPEMASECLGRLSNGDEISKIDVNVTDEGQFTYNIA
jgi:type VI secretion system protein VasG